MDLKFKQKIAKQLVNKGYIKVAKKLKKAEISEDISPEEFRDYLKEKYGKKYIITTDSGNVTKADDGGFVAVDNFDLYGPNNIEDMTDLENIFRDELLTFQSKDEAQKFINNVMKPYYTKNNYKVEYIYIIPIEDTIDFVMDEWMED